MPLLNLFRSLGLHIPTKYVGDGDDGGIAGPRSDFFVKSPQSLDRPDVRSAP